MKDLEGKDVFLYPTGNNAPRSGKISPEKATIVKVSRVYVTILKHGHRWEEKLRKHTNRERVLHDNHNGGYIVYASLQELEDMLEVGKIANKIWSKFSYPHNYKSLDLETIRKVAELLDV